MSKIKITQENMRSHSSSPDDVEPISDFLSPFCG